MIQLFLTLTTLNLAWLCLTAGLGYVTAARHDLGHWHMLCGVMATILCCAVHCVVFTYFIATAKWIQHAIDVKRLDPALAAPTRSFKAQAFPAALLAIGAVFATALFGAAADSYGARSFWHHVVALTAIIVNVLVATVEYRSIARNGALIDEVLEQARLVSP